MVRIGLAPVNCKCQGYGLRRKGLSEYGPGKSSS